MLFVPALTTKFVVNRSLRYYFTCQYCFIGHEAAQFICFFFVDFKLKQFLGRKIRKAESKKSMRKTNKTKARQGKVKVKQRVEQNQRIQH